MGSRPPAPSRRALLRAMAARVRFDANDGMSTLAKGATGTELFRQDSSFTSVAASG